MTEGTRVPEELRYTQEHEWSLRQGDIVVVGITDYAQHELGDVVYVELSRVGTRVDAMKEFGVIESVKSASDLFSPVTGEVVATNEGLAEHPEWVNESPYDQGWMIHVRPDDFGEIEALLDAAAYRKLIGA